MCYVFIVINTPPEKSRSELRYGIFYYMKSFIQASEKLIYDIMFMSKGTTPGDHRSGAYPRPQNFAVFLQIELALIIFE